MPSDRTSAEQKMDGVLSPHPNFGDNGSCTIRGVMTITAYIVLSQMCYVNCESKIKNACAPHSTLIEQICWWWRNKLQFNLT